jgi:hypothetical protein
VTQDSTVLAVERHLALVCRFVRKTSFYLWRDYHSNQDMLSFIELLSLTCGIAQLVSVHASALAAGGDSQQHLFVHPLSSPSVSSFSSSFDLSNISQTANYVFNSVAGAL